MIEFRYRRFWRFVWVRGDDFGSLYFYPLKDDPRRGSAHLRRIF